MTPTGRRWLGYTRVSTDEQGRSGLGLESQEASIRAAVAAVPGDVLVDLVVDAGESGKDLLRPGIVRVLDAIAAGEADGLIVAKLDRLTRRVADAAALIEWLDGAGATFRALDIGIDTTTPYGRMAVQLLAVFAEMERGMIAERTTAALAAKRARGEPSSPAVVDHPELAERVLRLRAEGWTFTAIADQFNAEGIPTLRGGKLWRQSSLSAVTGYKRRPKPPKPVALPELPRRRRRAS